MRSNRPSLSLSNAHRQSFEPSAHLGDEVNHNIIQSEIEGGVYLNDLPYGTKLGIETQNHLYTLITRSGSEAIIGGHPEFCPEPVLVKISGSTWGGSMLKLTYVGRGMHLEFRHRDYSRPIVTSAIVEIRELDSGSGMGASEGDRW